MYPIRNLRAVVVMALGVAFLLTCAAPGDAQFRRRFRDQSNIPEAPSAPASAFLRNDAWENVPMTPAKPGDIDRLIARQLTDNEIQAAPMISDEQFIRRVTIDLTGELPLPADVKEFVEDSDPAKRAKLIDRFLESEEFARYWAKYWRDVVLAKVEDIRGRALSLAFEEWLFTQFKGKPSWAEMTRTMLTAEGGIRFQDRTKNGQAYFLLSKTGPEGANDRAAETSRVFLGIQMRCAQCHDHPFDQWKQVQFHELAGYFARLRERALRENGRLAGLELVSLPRGEHEMPKTNIPGKSFLTYPRFMDGKAPSRNISDKARRSALADVIVDKNNYWFAAAFVNRIWSELAGQAFYQPIDDIGPGKEVIFPEVLARLAANFRATDYDIKQLYRTIMNSETYQRQSRLGDTTSDHLFFAAAYPTTLPGNAMWNSIVSVLGRLEARQPTRGRFGGYLRPNSLEAAFKQQFNFDPSTPPDEVEGSIPQALILMNNPVINQRIRATGTNLLARILKAYPQDDDAIRMVYLRTLARKPTTRELEKCKTYVGKVDSRAEAYEDILWALLNSTEFKTKR